MHFCIKSSIGTCIKSRIGTVKCFNPSGSLYYLGKRELVCVLFVRFASVGLCLFSLPLDVRDWLRLVIVTSPGLFTISNYMSFNSSEARS